MRLLFLPGSATSPSGRFRLIQFASHLRDAGHDLTIRVIKPDRMATSSHRSPVVRRLRSQWAVVEHVANALVALRDAAEFDIIMMNRDLIPETRITFLEPMLARRNPRLIFDFDDAIHIGARAGKLAKILPHFAHLTPGNSYLAEYARAQNPNVTILPTVVDTDAYFVAPERTPGPIRIGWSGSSYSARYGLPILQPILTRLANDHDFEFIAISNSDPQLNWAGVKTRYIPWTDATEVEGLQTIDIGLMPLNDEPFERGKCGLKAIQYMAVGVPAIVSPVGVNREIVIHGENGYHCTHDDQWIDTLSMLLKDQGLRARLGRQARARVEGHYSIRSLLPRMTQVFQTVAGQ